MIDLVVFLGNPGSQYERTRHNVAWMAAERLEALNESSRQTKFLGEYAGVPLGGAPLHVLWPQTYMNRCGESVGRCSAFFKLAPQRVLVVHDELELPFGVVSLRRGGGLGGHNGLKSVRAALTTADFLRLRIGISRPRHGNVSSYVLSRFSSDEEAALDHVLQASARIIERCAGEGRASQAAAEALLQEYRRLEVL